MKATRDLLTIKLDAARKRRELALKQVALADATIEDLLARKNAQFTRELRRTAHWPHRQSRAMRSIDALFTHEASL